jgi:Ca2+-binding EF-hand superfamily protein
LKNKRILKKSISLFLKVFDTDNSEYIDFTELMIAVSITSMGDLRKKITLAFVIYDIDKSGSIDQAEMTTLLQALYILLNYDDIIQCGWDSDEKVKQIMTHLDINHDGVVSKEEFIEGCLNDKEICSLFGFL